MKNKLKILSIFILIVSMFVSGFGQDTAGVWVLDKLTKEPIPFAHVCFESCKDGNRKIHCVTDYYGKVQNNNNFRTILAVSYIGYETLYDTLKANESKSVFLIPKIFNIDELVITAQFTPERADNSIYNIKVINKLQIASKGANNLSDLLAGELNMRTSNDGALGSSLSLQGLSGEHVKFLIDGVPVIGRMNGNIDLNQINLYNVDHIEIIEGPMSVIYGSNALAGVVNIITKENKTSNLQAHAGSYYESVGMYNLDVGASIRRKKHIFSVSAARNFFSGFSTNDSLRSKQWKPKRQYIADGYYIYSHSKIKLKLSSQFFHEHIQNRGNLLQPYYETAFDNYFFTKRWTNKVEISAKLKKYKFFNFVGAYSNFDWIKQAYFKDLTTLDKVLTANVADHDTTKINSVLLRGNYSKDNKTSWFNYQTGFDINVEKGTGNRITNKTQEIGDYAGFINIKAEPLKSVLIQPGLRYSYNTKYNAPLVYSLNMKWALKKKFTFRASYSKGFRAPALKELYLYFVDINHNIKGNEDLKAEYSDNFNFSLNYNIEREKNLYRFESSLFHNTIENIITLARENNDVYTYINLDEYITKGVKFDFTYKHYPRLNIKAGISETGRYNTISSANENLKEFSYSTGASLNLDYKFIKRDIKVSFYYKYNGKLPEIVVDENDEIVEAYIADYHTLDASVMKSFFNDRLSVSIGGKNLFNNKIIPAVGGGGGIHSSSSSSVPVGWGRTFFVRLSY
nr:TonB-dependent receptor [Bacteroidota bacterium]